MNLISQIISDLEDIQDCEYENEKEEKISILIEKLENVDSLSNLITKMLGVGCNKVTIHYKESEFLEPFDIDRTIQLFKEQLEEIGTEEFKRNNKKPSSC